MITAVYKGIEIEMRLKQLPDKSWTGLFVLDPNGAHREIFSPSQVSFPSREAAKESGLNEARAYIDNLLRLQLPTA